MNITHPLQKYDLSVDIDDHFDMYIASFTNLKINNFDEILFDIKERLVQKKDKNVSYNMEKYIEPLTDTFNIHNDKSLHQKVESFLRTEDVRDSLYLSPSKHVNVVVAGIMNEQEASKWTNNTNNGIYESVLKQYPLYDSETSFDLYIPESSHMEVQVISHEYFDFVNSEDKYNTYSTLLKEDKIRKFRIFGEIPFYVAKKDRLGFVFEFDKREWIPSQKAKRVAVIERKTNFHKYRPESIQIGYYNNHIALLDNKMYMRIREIKGDIIYGSLLDTHKKTIVKKYQTRNTNVLKVYACPELDKNTMFVGESYKFLYQDTNQNYHIVTAELVSYERIGKKTTIKNDMVIIESKKDTLIDEWSIKGDMKKSLDTSKVNKESLVVLHLKDKTKTYIVSFEHFKKLYLHTVTSFTELVTSLSNGDIIVDSKNNFYKFDSISSSPFSKIRDVVFICSNMFTNEQSQIKWNNIKTHVRQSLDWKEKAKATINVGESGDFYESAPDLYQLLVSDSKYSGNYMQRKNRPLINDYHVNQYLETFGYHPIYATSNSILQNMYEYHTHRHITSFVKKRKEFLKKIKIENTHESRNDPTSVSTQKSIHMKIIETILSISNQDERKDIMSKFVHKYCYLMRDTESDKLWYYVYESRENRLPVLCVHYKYWMEGDAERMKQIVSKSVDGFKLCSNCGEIVDNIEFDTFEGFDESDKVSRFRENAQTLADGTQIAGTGDSNLQMFFDVDVSNRQFPDSKAVSNTQNIEPVDRKRYGMITMDVSVIDLFEQLYQRLQLSPQFYEYRQFFKDESDWDKYIRYVVEIQNNFKQKPVETENIIQYKRLRETLDVLNKELADIDKRLKTLKKTDASYTELSESYKAVHKKYKSYKTEYDSKLKQKDVLVYRYYEKFARKSDPIVNFKLCIMIGLKHWFLSFYANRHIENADGLLQSWLGGEYEKDKMYAMEEILKHSVSVQLWMKSFDENKKLPYETFQETAYNPIVRTNLEDFFSIPRNVSLRNFSRYPYLDLIRPVESYRGNIDWKLVDEKMTYHAQIFVANQSISNRKTLSDYGEMYRKYELLWKDWFFQNQRIALIPNKYADSVLEQSYCMTLNKQKLKQWIEQHISEVNIPSEKYESVYRLYNYMYVNKDRFKKYAVGSSFDTFVINAIKTYVLSSSRSLSIDNIRLIENEWEHIYSGTPIPIENPQGYTLEKMYELLKTLISLHPSCQKYVSEFVARSFSNFDDKQIWNEFMETPIESFLREILKDISSKQEGYDFFGDFGETVSYTTDMNKNTESIRKYHEIKKRIIDFLRFYDSIVLGDESLLFEELNKKLKLFKHAEDKSYKEYKRTKIEKYRQLIGSCFQTRVMSPFKNILTEENLRLLEFVEKQPHDFWVKLEPSLDSLGVDEILYTLATNAFFYFLYVFFEDSFEDSFHTIQIVPQSTIKTKIFLYYFKSQQNRSDSSHVIRELNKYGFREQSVPTFDLRRNIKTDNKMILIDISKISFTETRHEHENEDVDGEEYIDATADEDPNSVYRMNPDDFETEGPLQHYYQNDNIDNPYTYDGEQEEYEYNQEFLN